VVSLVPAASAILVAMGATDGIVGRTRDDHTPELAGVAVVGRVLAPDLERITALEPALVVAWAGADLAPLRPLVEGSGGAVLPVRLERVADVFREIRRLGDALGRPRAAAALEARVGEEVRRVRAATAAGDRPLVVWVVSSAPLVVAGPGTLPDDLMRLAGARNAFADAAVPWVRPAPETVVARAPAVVVWPAGPGVAPWSDAAHAPPWSALATAERTTVLTVDPDLFHEAGPRVGRAAALLAASLHPHRAGSLVDLVSHSARITP
jgi:iron complex transport system substrate-binding protein